MVYLSLEEHGKEHLQMLSWNITKWKCALGAELP